MIDNMTFILTTAEAPATDPVTDSTTDPPTDSATDSTTDPLTSTEDLPTGGVTPPPNFTPAVVFA